MNYDRADIMNGVANQRQAQETPNSFATEQGVVKPEQNNRLDVSSERMAGQEGARFVRMMLDPAERARTQRWMSAFGMSNQGFEFNQAKMMLMGTSPQQQMGVGQQQQKEQQK